MNKKEALISIIVPVYKVEEYLNKCIDSILNQAYKNLEVILVDDGSPDRCGEICDEYAQKDDRVRVVHKQNGGLSDARNAGIDAATGEYLMFVDSDDYIHPEMAAKLYEALARDEADMALCNFLYVDENGEKTDEENDNSPIKDEVLTRDEAFCKALRSYKKWYYVVAWNKLYKKEIFKTLRFPYGKVHEDEFVIHKVLGACAKISCISDPLYYYVQRTGSIMSAEYSVKRLDIVEAFFDRTEFFLERNMREEAIRAYDMGIGFLRIGYRKLKRDDKNVKSILKGLKKRSDVLYKKIVSFRLSARDFIVFFLFFLQPVLCNFVLGNIQRLKRDNKCERKG